MNELSIEPLFDVTGRDKLSLEPGERGVIDLECHTDRWLIDR